jgi:hypothetical protein
VQLAKAWATDEILAAQTPSDTDSVRPWPSTRTPHRPHVNPLGDFWVICGNMSSSKVWRVNMARGSILPGNAKFVQFTRKRAKLGTFASTALCHSIKGNVSRDFRHSSTSRSHG